MLLNSITLCETAKLAENVFADVPHDGDAKHIEKINDKIKRKLAQAFDLYHGGKIVGILVSEVYQKEFHVLALKSYTEINCFTTVYPLVEKMANDAGCKSIVWQTIRAGLIKLAIENGFYISCVEMRKNIQ